MKDGGRGDNDGKRTGAGPKKTIIPIITGGLRLLHSVLVSHFAEKGTIFVQSDTFYPPHQFSLRCLMSAPKSG